MALVKWEVVQLPKEYGGLGAGDLVIKNAALLFKWWWRFANERNSLWKRVIQSIHKEDRALLPFCPQKKVSAQGTWQTIRSLVQNQHIQASKVFKQNLRLIVGDGSKIRFWQDQWTQGLALWELFPDLYKVSNQKLATISNMGWFEGMRWKWTLAWKRELSQGELQKLEELMDILSQHYPQQDQEDKVLWQGNNGYSVKDLQRNISKESEVVSLVSTVWMKVAPPKVELFMWLALLGKLNTRHRLHAKGILQEATCTFCQSQPESLDHVLMSCTYSQQVWKLLASDLGHSWTIPNSFKQHYENWMGLTWRNALRKKLWISTFFATTWTIWLTRNAILFQGQSFHLMDICQSVKRQIALWSKVWDIDLPCTENELARNFAHIPEVLR